ncbi:hypothetical protein NQ152_00840 [Microbacterium sp. zg.B48]|uniref:hypothetical protein n=1 Tax=unclassified Microbacterium TaxID=2609290 RepID=UPI00214B398B|nr:MULTISPECIES: hypothetical protein [unclassified Microbacterium]MCR2762046.1 hypothetical protein [Microbacterium sp. zg.B48]MCR2809946.1 hypothetical protein [Microbacterium sp. zg.B185]WIM17749.1 hypothetical protein QNO12_08935 [Microbacterium sp. zg-B185]
MAILRLESITCLGQAETFTDELYVTFNGTKRSLPNMTKGQTRSLSDEFEFDGERELSLFENDGDHWYDRDDFIGKQMISPSPADLTLQFSGSGNAGGARYSLSVSVDPPPQSAILRLRSITCNQQAETFTDELYVTFNGVKRSLPNMTQGQTKDLRDEFVFNGARELTLFENDGDHWYDRDDFIAKHTITTAPRESTVGFVASGGNAEKADYSLSLSVTPVP